MAVQGFFYRLVNEPIIKQYKEHVTNIDLVTSTHPHNLIIYDFIHNLYPLHRTTPPAITYLILYSLFMPKWLPLQPPDNRPHYIFIYSTPSSCYTTLS